MLAVLSPTDGKGGLFACVVVSFSAHIFLSIPEI